MIYGVTYLQMVFPKGHKLEWLRYCALTDILPKDLKNEIFELADKINTTFKNDIIVPMDKRVCPGCSTTPESIEKIATAMYEGFRVIFKDLGGDNFIRCVYTTGEIPEEWMSKEVKSTHEVGSFPVMIKLGRYLSSSDEPGLFKI